MFLDGSRFVDLQVDLGQGNFRYGSGLLLDGSKILTSAHVITGAEEINVRRPGRESQVASFEPVLVGDTEGFDVALLTVLGAPEKIPGIAVARLKRDATADTLMSDCWTVGYPSLQNVERSEGWTRRDTKWLKGYIPPLSNLKSKLLSLQVYPPEQIHIGNQLPPGRNPLEASEKWKGMSGAPVFANVRGEIVLVGVVTTHVPRRGPWDITVTPLDLLFELGSVPDGHRQSWWGGLGVSDPNNLRSLPERPEPSYRATLRQIHDYTPELKDREGELSKIFEFAAGHGDVFGEDTSAGGYLWLRAGPWAGKTSLLASAVHSPSLTADVDVVAYFLIARHSEASQNMFLDAVIRQLAWYTNQDVPGDQNRSVFLSLWSEAERRAQTYGRRLLLVVDGLDEDLRPDGYSVASLLPAKLESIAHVLVSSRLHPDVPTDVDPRHPLHDAARHAVDLRESPHAAEAKILAEAEIRHLLTPGMDYSGLAHDVLGLLTAATGPLSISDLAQALGRDRAELSAFVNARAARSLKKWGATNGGVRYEFAHQTLLESCQEDHDVGRDQRHRDRLYTWADRWRDQRWSDANGDGAGTPLYLLNDYPKALAGAADKVASVRSGQTESQRLAALVTDVLWLDCAVSRIGVDNVLATLRDARRIRPNDRSVEFVSRLLLLQLHHLRDPRLANRTGATATHLAWEALRAGLGEVASAAADQLRQVPGPQLVPLWTSERIGPHLSRIIDRHNTGVSAVTVTADGRVVSAGRDGVLRVCDLNRLDAPGQVFGRAGTEVRALVDFGGGWLVSGEGSGAVSVWDLGNPGTGLRELGRHGSKVRAVAVHAGQVISGGDNGKVWLWDAGRLRPGRELTRQAGRVWALTTTATGGVVAGGEDGAVRMWDRPDSDARELGRHGLRVRAVAATREGRVVSGGDDRAVMLWDPADPNDVGRELGRHERMVWAVAATRDGRVVSAGADGAVMLWDPADPDDTGRELGAHAVWALAATADGRVVAGTGDGAVQLWDPASSHGPGQESRHTGQVYALALTPGGRVVAGTGDGYVRLWDPAQADTRGQDLGRHNGRVRALVVTPDGRHVVSSGADGVLRLWDLDHPDAASRELGRHDGVLALAATTDVHVVSAGRDGVLRLWDLDHPDAASGELGRHDGVLALAATTDVHVVSAGRDGDLRLWDLDHPDAASRELGRHGSRVRAVAATADRRVISGGSDGALRLWDLERPGNPSQELGQHGGELLAIAVLPEGLVITGGDDSVLRLWDLNDPDEPGRYLARHTGAVRAISVAEDGRVAVATGSDLSVFELSRS
ncbi:trypsin-like peptidase domain-containing protein [Streptomyces sp. NPDC001549]|uniref:trypsin-like peptidase domain-containing protein n=1 Tax=Streptomyces sp. NPDC001549 TaxID=3364586 RepID=UPI0036C243C5